MTEVYLCDAVNENTYEKSRGKKKLIYYICHVYDIKMDRQYYKMI